MTIRALSGVRLLLGLIIIAILGVASYWSLRLAFADHLFHKDSAEGPARAARLVPGNAEYRARVEDLEAAVSQNPAYSAGWMQMGLRAEMNGDLSAAERFLLEAAQVDKTFEPSWTLANFYFRRDREEEFWKWAAAASEVAYTNPGPLFLLCWKVTQDSDLILNRVIGERPEVLRWYLGFLLARDQLDAAVPVAQRLLDQSDQDSLRPLLAFIDSHIKDAEPGPAISIWNGLSDARRIAHQQLAPERGASLTNGDFTVPPISQGFDWRLPASEGVTTAVLKSQNALRITLTGRQPEKCELLRQFVPLQAGRTYRFRFEARANAARPLAGVSWHVYDSATGEELAVETVPASQPDWEPQSFSFSTSSGTQLGRLVLVYRRTPGTTRGEGSLWLRNLSLDFSE